MSAPPKTSARFVTASNTEDGFAIAMERFVLPAAGVAANSGIAA
jgi:hypothetical protein